MIASADDASIFVSRDITVLTRARAAFSHNSLFLFKNLHVRAETRGAQTHVCRQVRAGAMFAPLLSFVVGSIDCGRFIGNDALDVS